MIYRGPSQFGGGRKLAITRVILACGLWLILVYGSQAGSLQLSVKVSLLALLFVLIVGGAVMQSQERIELKKDYLEARRGLTRVRIHKSDINQVLLPVDKSNITIELKSGERVDMPGLGCDEWESEVRNFIDQWRKAA